MTARRPITSRTLEGIASEIAELSIEPSMIKMHVEALQPLMETIAALRELSLKEIEPALIFKVEEDR